MGPFLTCIYVPLRFAFWSGSGCRRAASVGVDSRLRRVDCKLLFGHVSEDPYSICSAVYIWKQPVLHGKTNLLCLLGKTVFCGKYIFFPHACLEGRAWQRLSFQPALGLTSHTTLQSQSISEGYTALVHFKTNPVR